MNNISKEELKNKLTLKLQAHNLEQTLINQLLSNEFINGAYELLEAKTKDESLMLALRETSVEQSFQTMTEMRQTISKLFYDGSYLCNIMQYIIDSWKNIDFSRTSQVNQITYRASNNTEINTDDLEKTLAIRDVFSDMIEHKFPPRIQAAVGEAFLFQSILETVQGHFKKFYKIAEKFYDDMMNLVRGKTKQSMQEIVANAEQQGSPLVLDLDGDGVESSGKDQGIYFDHDNNGFAESTGWVGKDDGLLVRDINGNGQIDNGTELFGNNSVLSSGQKAANGFEALKDLDSNHDGIFNNLDTAWSQVKVWKDANQDGLVNNGELLSLEQAGVSDINLNYQNSSSMDANNNEHKQQGTFIKTDGTTASIHDVWFDADYADTSDKIEIDIPDAIKLLPDISGFGNVHSLQATMALDSTGALQALVEQYVNEENLQNRENLLTDIIYHWTGVQDIDPLSRKPSYFYDNPIGDARKLEALERFLGQKYANRWWFGREEQNPHEQASQVLLTAYDKLQQWVKLELEAQTHLKPILDNIKLTWNTQTQKWDVDIKDAVAIIRTWDLNTVQMTTQVFNLQQAIAQESLFTDEIFTAFSLYFTPEDPLYQLFLSFGNYSLYPNNNNNFIEGDDDSNIINGFGGNDKIFGQGGDDQLIGGSGDDYLVGGSGFDTYYFDGNFGHDCIDNSSTDEKGAHPDTIEFGAGILPADVTVLRQGNDLILSLNDGANTVKVYSYFLDAGNTTNTVDSIKFADGTVWTYDTIRVKWNAAPVEVGGTTTIEGGSGNDALYGSNNTDFLIGNDGNDYLNGGNGNDILYGGKGNDSLYGGTGNDLYIWNLGDGKDYISDNGNYDTISFGPGISFADLTFRNVNNDLQIMVKNDPTQGLTLSSFFYSLSYKIEDLTFADGTVVHLSEIGLVLQQQDEDRNIKATEFADTIYCGNNGSTVLTYAGNDIIYGGNGTDRIIAGDGNDTLIGGLGNDNLEGDAGDDTYVWNLGDGLDKIYNTKGSDVLKFGPGIAFSDLKFTFLDAKDGASLLKSVKITVKNDPDQGLILDGQLYQDGISEYGIRYLEFSDGSRVDLKTIGLEMDMFNGVTNGRGTIYNDVLYAHDAGGDISALTGDDIIYGGNGTDRIIAGDGNDTLVGGLGNDQLQGDAGDDTYVWNLGDGLDKIYDTQGSDVLKFGPGIAFSDLKFTFLDAKGGASLLKSVKITVKNDPDQGLILDGQLYQDGISEYGIRYLEFSNGSRVDLKTIGLEMDMFEGVTNGRGTIYDDVLYAHDAGGDISSLAGDDIIYGGNGTDRIIAGDGNDTLIGGLGNDNLYGDAGDDTYVWNLGDGLDKIYDTQGSDVFKFGPGIAFSDLKFTFLDAKGGASLLKSVKITVKNDPDQGIILDGQLYQDGISEYGIRYLEFSDGSRVDLKTIGLEMDMFEGVTNGRGTIYDDVLYAHDAGGDISSLAGDDIIYGGNGTDRIIAGDGNDTLVGGLGNDQLQGDAGDDTYIWNLGDGLDSITDSGGNDKIVFGQGITQNDLSFEKNGYYLKILVNGNDQTGLQISSHFYNNTYKIETIEFHDGTTLDISNADQLIQAMSTFGVEQGASDNRLSNPTQDVSELYNLTVNNGITQKAI